MASRPNDPAGKEKREIEKMPLIPWWWVIGVMVCAGIVSGGLYLITK